VQTAAFVSHSTLVRKWSALGSFMMGEQMSAEWAMWEADKRTRRSAKEHCKIDENLGMLHISRSDPFRERWEVPAWPGALTAHVMARLSSLVSGLGYIRTEHEAADSGIDGCAIQATSTAFE